MIIIETKLVTRPSTSKEFFNKSSDSTFLAVKAEIDVALGPYKEPVIETNYYKNENVAGTYTFERTTSEDGLLQTNVATFANLELYSTYDTILSIALDHAYQAYVEGDDFTPPSGLQYTLSGIDAPFSCTTTYNYTADTFVNYPLLDAFFSTLELSDKLQSFTNTGTSVIAVHHYFDSDDFVENHWFDYHLIPGLYAGGVTRTISYQLL